MAVVQDREALLRNPTYVDVLLSIVLGYECPTAIAKLLRKKQPTITEELSVLRRAGLVSLGERTKAQQYVLNWDMLLDELYGFALEILEERSEWETHRIMERVKEQGIAKVIPAELFKSFLKSFFDVQTDLGGLVKSYYDLCLGFFKALGELNEKEWSELVRRFGIDKKLLGELASFVAIELYINELVALQAAISESPEKTESHSSKVAGSRTIPETGKKSIPEQVLRKSKKA